MTLQLESIAKPAAEADAKILTPLPAAGPRINGAMVVGVRPGSPLLYTIAASGSRPMRFGADDLPRGLRLDAHSGQIKGVLAEPGSYTVRLWASNGLGTAERSLRIVVGQKLALTPPMGWNSWNCWGPKVDQQKVLDAARAMVASGLVEHGWSYINIDDGWQGLRDPVSGALQPNEKFPDLPGLCDAIHAMGLKAGIYSTPWVKSFAGYPGGTSGGVGGPVRDESKGWYIGRDVHEVADAGQWARWGIDYLKYDWGPMDLPSGRRMREALLKCGRDIVFNPTNSAPEADFAEWSRLAECYFLWRRPSTGDCDIADSWKSVSSIGFRMHEWTKYVEPGHWNDPDMLVVGQVGWGRDLHACQLTPDEQYTHISLWCLLAAPLLLGCDLTRLDAFTVGLLTNDEVLEVNQDSLGQMARRVSAAEGHEVWAKPLEDGSLAVGLFNRSEIETTVCAAWSELGIEGHWRVRDLWRQQDVGVFTRQVNFPVMPHGVTLLRLARECDAIPNKDCA